MRYQNLKESIKIREQTQTATG